MRTTVTAITSLALAANTSIGLAASAPKTATAAATHAVRGTVKSISTFFIVAVTGSEKKPREMTFMLAPETERAGNLSIGAIVSIRYRLDGHVLVATAVSAEPDRGAAIAASLHR
jgi:hypothetical protein